MMVIVIGKLHIPNVHLSHRTVTVVVELPALVTSPSTLPLLHVSSVVFSSVVTIFDDPPELKLNVSLLPVGHFEVQGLVVVEQSTVAEAVLEPTHAINAVAVTTARPMCFAFFILTLLQRP